MPEKACTRCGETKPLEKFPVLRSRSDGRDSKCKECHSKATRERRQQRAAEDPKYNRDRIAAHRAGMRKDKCALCAKPIQGTGLCEACTAAVMTLGGTEEALKRAVRAVRYMRANGMM